MCLDKYLKEKNTKCDSAPSPTIFFFLNLAFWGFFLFSYIFEVSSYSSQTDFGVQQGLGMTVQRERRHSVEQLNFFLVLFCYLAG